MSDETTIEDIIASIRKLGLSAERQKAMLQRVVAETWPARDDQAKLEVPIIREFREASVAACVVPVFKDESGIYQAVVGIPGDHYYAHERTHEHRMRVEYAAFGGFLNLDNTPGTTFIPPRAGKAEDPNVGALRELEEEMPNDMGKPVLARIDPKRLVPMDTKTITRTNGDRTAVVGFMLKLEPHEVAAVKSHVERMKDHSYHQAVRTHTTNPVSQKPEICAPRILPLNELAHARNKHPLLLPSQAGLFQNIASTLTREELNANGALRRDSLLERLDQISGKRTNFIR